MYEDIAFPDISCLPGCSRCCEGHRGNIFVSDEEWIEIERFIKNNHLDYILDAEDCPFLKDHRCSIYEVRPLVCRLYGQISSLFCKDGTESTLSVGIVKKLLGDYKVTDYTKKLRERLDGIS